MVRKEDSIDNWIPVKRASEVLTARSGHDISQDYVRRLGNTGKLTTRRIDERTKLYSLKDVERYTVKERGDGSVRRAARAPKSQQAEEPAYELDHTTGQWRERA